MNSYRKGRSIRRHKPVPDDNILKVLEAGRFAPSGGNRQPWHFIVVKDKETRRKLAGGQEWAVGALAAADMDLMRRNEKAKQLLEV